MKRALVIGVLVILGTFVVSVLLNVWITWAYVLPQFDGPSDYLSPGLKFPLGLLKDALDDVPDRDPAALSAHLGLDVHVMTDAERDAFMAGPALSVPLGRGETFHLRHDKSAIMRLADGKALMLGQFQKVNPIRAITLTVWIGVVLALALVACALIFMPLTRQVRRLEDTARTLSSGNLAARAPTTGAMRDLGVALNMLAARTERLIRSHEELLQSVSHELRTPAARIRFQMELLDAEPDATARRKRSDAIDRDLDELDALIGELLSFSRLVADAPQWTRAPLVVAPVAGELAEEAADGTELRCVVTSRERTQVVADARAFRRALRNLVSNAMKAAKSEVAIGWTVEDAMVRITVDDDGPGVPVADRERIFAPFVVGEASRARVHGGGVGLGLAIVQRIVELHGGSVSIEDAPLGGARFVTTWPRAEI